MNHIIYAEYLWLDINIHIRSKTRIIYNSNNNNPIISNLYDHTLYPIWNFDGSSTGQTNGTQTEIMLKPVKCVIHPMFPQQEYIPNKQNGNLIYHILILCECYDTETNLPHQTNTRYIANQLFQTEKSKNADIWFGIEQEFFFFEKITKKPIDWENRYQQGEYYCGNNRSTNIERQIMNEFVKSCLDIGLQIYGYNQEVAHGQWEYQIGPLSGIEAADQMIIAKFILFRICEKYDLYTSFHPKPIGGDWNGSGCHINISTKNTREDTDLIEINRIIANIGKDHSNWIGEYDGVNNHLRLCGKYETSDSTNFTFGVGTRHTSIRIPNQVAIEGKGYFEDRRPGASIDYYKTISKYVDYL